MSAIKVILRELRPNVLWDFIKWGIWLMLAASSALIYYLWTSLNGLPFSVRIMLAIFGVSLLGVIVLSIIWRVRLIKKGPLGNLSNAELKRQAYQLKADILQFLADKHEIEPKLERVHVPNPQNKKSAAFKRFDAAWQRHNEATIAHSQKVKNEFILRFSGRFHSIMEELKLRGVDLDKVCKSVSHFNAMLPYAAYETNPLSMIEAAKTAEAAANELPDN